MINAMQNQLNRRKIHKNLRRIYDRTCFNYQNHYRVASTAYGRYKNVFLRDEELTELQTELPTLWQNYIDRLSEYMAYTGKQYQSHAATIRRWAAEDKKKAATQGRNRDYSVQEGETV